MKALLTRRSIIIASLAFLIALIAVISVNVFNSAGPVTGFANTITMPVRALASTLAQTFGDIFSAIYRYEELERRNDELSRLVVRYEQDYRDAAILAQENAELRELLGVRERFGDFQQEPATLRGWGGDNWSSSFEINRGYANSNIARGMGVATEYGALIGQVFEVRATTSIVITILDTRFSAAAFVGRPEGGVDADSSVTASGNFLYMRSGLLTLDNIDDDLTILPGDLVSTSGLGGVFPFGLVVGEVDEVHRHASGIGRFATVKPVRDIETVTTVYVITEFENPE
jgi:rod shape-determining protein MreC